MNSPENNNQLWFLTGNLGTGKSSVLRMLVERKTIRGYHADEIAKHVMERDSIKRDPSIFTNPEEKQKTENLVHPKVWEEIEKNISNQHNKIIIIESALVFEVGWDKKSPDNIIVTTCDPKIRNKRLIEDRYYTQEYIDQILKHQLPQEFKEKNARIIIDTNCPKRELWKKIDKVRRYLKDPNNKEKLVL